MNTHITTPPICPPSECDLIEHLSAKTCNELIDIHRHDFEVQKEMVLKNETLQELAAVIYESSNENRGRTFENVFLSLIGAFLLSYNGKNLDSIYNYIVSYARLIFSE